MQHIDYIEDYNQVDAVVEKLVRSGDIEKELAEFIKVDEIKNAIKTVGPLIKDAKNIFREKQFLLCENYNKLVDSTDNKNKVIIISSRGFFDAAAIIFETSSSDNLKILFSCNFGKSIFVMMFSFKSPRR